MIHASKIDDNPATWGLFVDGSDEPEVVCFDDKIVLKIVTLWNRDEADKEIRHQNLEALERQPKNE